MSDERPIPNFVVHICKGDGKTTRTEDEFNVYWMETCTTCSAEYCSMAANKKAIKMMGFDDE